MDRTITTETLKPWRDKMKSFITTEESKIILEACEKYQVVIIRGAPGCGKSLTAYHAAVHLEENHSYNIFPVNDPENIKKFTNQFDRSVFIFDDIFGKYCFNQTTCDRWVNTICDIHIMLSHIIDLKLIITCRSQLQMPLEFKQLGKNSKFEYQLRLNYSDKEEIAKTLCNKFAKILLDDSQYYDLPFFPLICVDLKSGVPMNKCVKDIMENEIKNLKRVNTSAYISLGLLVVFNNLILKQHLDKERAFIDEIIHSLNKECQNGINLTSIEVKNLLYCLKGTYVLENEIGFTSINTNMFDCIANCVGREICETILMHSSDTFLIERLIFQSFQKEEKDNLIPIPNTLHDKYFERVLKMFNFGHVEAALDNVQSNCTPYRCALINYHKSKNKLSKSNDETTNCIRALHMCLKFGYSEIVDYILTIDHELVNMPYQSEEQPLHVACEHEHYDCVEKLIKHGANINKTNKNLGSPLHIACNKRNTKLAALLINNNADINQYSDSYGTPMFIASKDDSDELDLIKTLVDSGADINKKSNKGFTPLHEACANSRTNIVRFLLQHPEIKINETDDSGRTALSISSLRSSPDLVNMLLMNKASVNKADNKRWTPLHNAVHCDSIEVAELLLKHKASINKHSESSYSPLTCASGKGFLSMVQLLIKNQADIDGDAKVYRKTPLYAAYKCKHTNIARYLLQQLQQVKDNKSSKYMSLFTACLMNDVAGVEYLLNNKKLNIEINHKQNGDTVLSFAIRQNNLALVKVILSHKPDVNLQCEKDLTPLCLACKNGETNIVELLIHHKASLNRKTKSGLTPLFISCLFGHVRVTTILLRNPSIILDDTDHYEWTPLKVSCFTGTVEMVRLLLNHKASVNSSSGVRWTTVKRHSKGPLSKNVETCFLKVNNDFKIKQTPLCICCWKQNKSAIRLLIENEADINQGELNEDFESTYDDCKKYIESRKEMDTFQKFESIHELTSLQIACYQDKNSVIKLLVDHKASVNMFLPEGIVTKEKIVYEKLVATMKKNAETMPNVRPLTVAIKKGCLPIVELILERSPKVNMPSRDGATPLHLAISKNETHIVELLLKRYKCETNHYMHGVGTPLMLACRMKDLHMVKMLVCNGSSVNQVGEGGLTALQIAVAQNSTDIIHFLSEKGADVSPKGQTGPSPFRIARSNKESFALLGKYNVKVKTGKLHDFLKKKKKH